MPTAFQCIMLATLPYDGVGQDEVVKIGFREAERIIDWVETRTAAA